MCCKYRLGGVYSKIWAPSIPGAPQKFFPESKDFSGKCWRRGGGGREVDVIFRKQKSRNLSQNKRFFPEISKIFSEEILHFLKISSMPGPPPRKLSPPFLLFFGGVTPPTPPPGGTTLFCTHLFPIIIRIRLLVSPRCHPQLTVCMDIHVTNQIPPLFQQIFCNIVSLDFREWSRAVIRVTAPRTGTNTWLKN